MLIEYLKSKGRLAIAFSGGVDSTFLAYAAKAALGENAVIITVDSQYIPRWELEESKKLSRFININHDIVKLDNIPENVKYNPEDRCYLCKKVIFNLILERAKGLGFNKLADGSNYDDTMDYRPGLKALNELNVFSPLLEMRWTKSEIREMSKRIGLPTYDKPAYACLLTRIPYGYEINADVLKRIETSEVYMMQVGFRKVRVRYHGDLARIEVDSQDRYKLFDENLLDDISYTLKGYGFTYVTFEASGYETGSFNKQIGK
jgi:uncharacterized protein